MEQSKYYTPEIEEFHVGFEYQIYEDFDIHPLKSWHYQIYGKDGNNPERLGYVGNWNLDKFRVKYLDQEDIESLGFEYIGSGWYNLKKVPGSLGYFLYVRLQKWGDKIYIKAYRQDPATTDFNNCEYCDKEDLVSGAVIKNKSELKRLMKQLGIDD